MTRLYTLQEIATLLDAELTGDGTVEIARVVHPADYAGPQDLALVMDPKLRPLLQGKGALAAVVAGDADAGLAPNQLRVKRPRLAMATLTGLFEVKPDYGSGVHASAVIDPAAQIGRDVVIGPFCTVGPRAIIGDRTVLQAQVTVEADAQIGADSVLRAGVRLGQGCVLGARCIVHFNTAIGSDGFSYVTPERGSVEAAKADGAVTATNSAGLLRIASLGPVLIGDDVEIGSNSSIDRGTVAPTRIGRGTKIDNQVQIGHNVQIGEDCLLCGRVGIAGSARIGNRVVIGGASGVADQLQVGDDAVVMAMSGVSGNVPARQLVGGIPAVPRTRLVENLLMTNRLKFLFKQVESLAEGLKRLEPADKKG